MPDVSVVLPVFNSVRTIRRAVRSILDQTMPDLELIVVDDGSTDGTVSVLYQVNDPRLQVVKCSHRGVAETANTGSEIAVAPLIARMDADDIAYPLRLELQVRWLHEQELDVVGCQVRIVTESRRIASSMDRYQRWINQETNDHEQIMALRFVEFPLVNPTILARRSYFEMGFSAGEYPEDYDLMLRAAEQGFRFGKVPEILFDWSDHSGRLTRTDSHYSPNAFMHCRRKHLLASPLRDVRCVDLWGIGPTGKSWLRWLQAQEIVVRRGFDVNERKVNKVIRDVPVLHPDEMPNADGTPLVIAVGAAGARKPILAHIENRGYMTGHDAWFVA